MENNHSFQTPFGPATRVFEGRVIFKNKDTGELRITKDIQWCWAPSIEEAKEYFSVPYTKLGDDDRYLETLASVMVKPVELVGEPNPDNIKNMNAGKAFGFHRDKPGIMLSKWGY